MTDERQPAERDVMARLAAYSPTRDTIAAEWTTDDRAGLRARLLADDTTPRRTRFRPNGPRRARPGHVLAPLVAAAAIVALIVGVVAFAVRHDGGSGDHGLQPGGEPYSAPTIRETPVAGPGQYAYTVGTDYQLSASGQITKVEHTQNWVSPDGDSWSYRVSGSNGEKTECFHFPFQKPASFGVPDKAFIDALPTDPDKLLPYLRSHVSGSSSTEEAVFVAVSDLLGAADGLTTATLRAALVSVLSRTGGVTVHPKVVDANGRASVRADFVDQAKRPGELHSLYFDAASYQLLEVRDGSTGAPGGGPSDAPGSSVPYRVAPSGRGTPVELTGSAGIYLNTAQTVVDRLPDKVKGCNESDS